MGDSAIISRETLMELSKERLVDIILLQANRIVQLEETITRLEKRIEELEARLNANSTNSNQPPSSDGPYKKPDKQPGKRASLAERKGIRVIANRCWDLRKPGW